MNAPETFSNRVGLSGLVQKFFALEAAGGFCLIIAAAIALGIANSPLAHLYAEIFSSHAAVIAINDGLMALFFLLVGLEIKRELVVGELSTRQKAMLPLVAAIGGMVVPAGIYAVINMNSPATIAGWAIPSATDIAFSLGVLALLGSRIPLGLKILLTAIAVIDDLGAILIITFFYSSGLSLIPLGAGLLCTLAMIVLNRRGCSHLLPYLVIGAGLWAALFFSGVHPTLAGVVTALCIPLTSSHPSKSNPLEHLEHILHPWVVYAVMPIFAFANAGVPFAGMSMDNLSQPITLGVILGLFAGKFVGIFAAFAIAIKTGLSPMPAGLHWRHLWGLSHLCGIGFTMSLFIGELAFSSPELKTDIRLGVLAGSVLSAVVGYLVLRSREGEVRQPAQP